MKKVIVIEDEAVLRDLISEELEKSGLTVVKAADGSQGWELIKQERPDLILLDLLMPVMSGYDVLSELRASAELSAIPCIVISNSGQIDDLNRAYELGADSVLIKAEFNPEYLVKKIKELLK